MASICLGLFSWLLFWRTEHEKGKKKMKILSSMASIIGLAAATPNAFVVKNNPALKIKAEKIEAVPERKKTKKDKLRKKKRGY